MAYRYAAPAFDGRVIEFNSEEPLTEEEGREIANYLAQQDDMQRAQLEATAAGNRGVLGFLQDTGLGLGKTALGLAALPAEVGTLLGIEGLRDVSTQFEEWQQDLQELKTEKIKAQEQLFQETEGFWDTLGFLANNLMYSADQLIELIPQMYPVAKAGQGARALAQAVLKKDAQSAAKYGVAGGLGAAATMQGSDIGMQTYDRVYQQLVEQGVPEDKAAEQALSEARYDAAQAGAITIGTGALIPGATAVERALLGKLTTEGVQQAVKAAGTKGAVKGFVGEASQEGLEESGGQLISNVSVAQYDPTVDVYEGVAKAGALGAALGGPFGGVAGAITGRQQNQLAKLQEEVEAARKQQQEAAIEASGGQLPLPGFGVGETYAPQAGPLPQPQVEPEAAPEVAPEQMAFDLPLPEPPPPPKPDQWFPQITDPTARIERIQQEKEAIDTDPAYADFSPQDKKAAIASMNRAINTAKTERAAAKRQVKEDAAKAEASAFTTAEEDLFGIRPTQPEPQVERPVQGPQRPVSEAFGGPQRELPMRMPMNFSEADFFADTEVKRDGAGKPRGVGQTFDNVRRRLVGLDLSRPQDRQEARKVMDYLDGLKRPSVWAKKLVPALDARLNAAEDVALQRGLEQQEEVDQRARYETERKRAELLEAGQRRVEGQAVDAATQAQREAEIEQGFADLEQRKPETLSEEQKREDFRRMEADEFQQTMEAQRANFDLEEQFYDSAVVEQTPEQRAQTKQETKNLINDYARAVATNDARGVNAANASGRQLLGADKWVELKENILNARKRQMRSLTAQITGRGRAPVQPDMFAQQERIDRQIRELGEENQRLTEEAARANQEAADAKAAADAAAKAAAAAQKAADDAKRQAEENDRKAAEEAKKAEQERKNRARADKERRKAAAAAAAPVEARPTREVEDELNDVQDRIASGEEGLNQQKLDLVREYITSQTGQLPTREEINDVLTAMRTDDIMPVFEPKGEYEAKAAEAVPQSVVLLTDAETQEEFRAAANAAVEEGYLSQEEADAASSAFGTTAIGNIKARQLILKRASDTEYFRNNPEKLKEWNAFLKTQEKAELGEYSRSSYGEFEPLSTVGELSKKFAPLLKRLAKYNKINIVQSTADLPIDAPDNVRGLYLNGEVYVVADNVSDLSFEEVVAHELVGHLGLEQIMGRGPFMQLLKQIRGLRDTNPRIRTVLENIKKAYTNEQGDYNLDEIQEAREILAHIAQDKAGYLTDSAVKRAYNSIVNKVKQFLARLGFINAGDALIDQLIYEAAMHVQGGKHAIKPLATFGRSEYGAAEMMQRAWDHGYRGFDLNEAGAYMRGLATDTVVPERSAADLEDVDAIVKSMEDAAFSRAETIDPATIAPENRRFIRQPEPPKTLLQRFTNMFMSPGEFMVKAVDTGWTFQRKMMDKFGMSIYDAKAKVINPVMALMQALRSGNYTNSYARTGWLEFGGKGRDGADMTGMWHTDAPEGTKTYKIQQVFKYIAELGKKVGGAQIASEMAHQVFVARRELEIHERNEQLMREIERLEATGKKSDRALAKRKREQIKDIFLKVEDGRTVPMDSGEIDARLADNRDLVKNYYDKHQELRDAYAEYDGVRKYLVELGAKHGLFTKEKMEEWLDNSAYVPFYRLQENMDQNDLIRGGSGLMSIETMKQLRGSAKEVNNVMDNMMSQAMWMTSSIIRAQAGRDMYYGLKDVGGIKATYNNEEEIPQNAEGIITFYEDGKKRWAQTEDPLDAYAWRGSEHVAIPGIKFLSRFANFMRKGITLSPEFIVSQLSQDSFRAMQLAGLKHPEKAAAKVVSDWYKIRKDIAAGGLGDERINRFGQVGMFDSTPDMTRKELEEQLDPSKMSRFDKTMNWFEANAEASDLAMRKAVYEQTLAEGGSEQLAVWRAAEIINFSRRGASPLASFARQVIPFFGAWTQGQSVLWRTVMGKGLAQTDRTTALKLLGLSTAKVMMLSFAMAAAFGDDDEYQDQPDYIRHRYMLIPSPFGDGYMKFAMPADLGLVTKMLPEMLAAEMMGYSKDSEQLWREFSNAFKTALLSPNIAAPQAVKPLLEAATNYNFFQDRPIVGMAQGMLEVEQQFTEDTSQLARLLGQTGLVSPMKADHVLKAMFGTIGQDLLVGMDAMYEYGTDTPRTSRELAQLPVLRAFFTRETGAADRTNFFKVREDKMRAVATFNKMVREGRIEEAREYARDPETRRLLQSKTQINKIDNLISESNRRVKAIEANPKLTPDEKKEAKKKEREYQNRLAAQARRTRKYIYEGE